MADSGWASSTLSSSITWLTYDSQFKINPWWYALPQMPTIDPGFRQIYKRNFRDFGNEFFITHTAQNLVQNRTETTSTNDCAIATSLHTHQKADLLKQWLWCTLTNSWLACQRSWVRFLSATDILRTHFLHLPPSFFGGFFTPSSPLLQAG